MSKLKIVPTAAAFAASRSLFPGLAQWAKNGENVAIISATCSMNFYLKCFLHSKVQMSSLIIRKNFFFKNDVTAFEHYCALSM